MTATTHDLVAKLASDRLDKQQVRAFADHISAFEAASGIKHKKVLVNGIPPFDDIPTVEFDIPKTKLAAAIDKLLGNGHFNPNVIINGIPAFDHYQVRVMGGR